ncbi:MAG: hypothetical protein ABFC77_01920 [Thermoguttaceae bacterium]
MGCAWDFSAPRSKTPAAAPSSDVGRSTVEKPQSDSPIVAQKKGSTYDFSAVADDSKSHEAKLASYQVAAAEASKSKSPSNNAVEPTVDVAPLPAEPAPVQTAKPEVVPRPQAAPLDPPSSATASEAKTPDGPSSITLHADNLDVRKVFEMVSRQTKGVSILVTPGVKGAVTVDIREKPLDESLQLIATLCRLSVQRQKDVIYISTVTEALERESDNLPVRVYHLNYVRSSDVVKMIKPLLSKKGSISQSPDSETGYPAVTVTVTNTGVSNGNSGSTSKSGGNNSAGGEILIVQDYEQTLKSIDRAIAEIDIQPTQVLIEAVICSVKLTSETDLGVNYAVLDNAGNALGVVGSGAALNAAAGFTPASVLASPVTNSLTNTVKSTNGLTTRTSTLSTGSTGKLANGFADGSSGFKYGWSSKNVTGFIQALQTRGETKVLASPRIMVLNKQGAVVNLGENLAYYTNQMSQTTTTQTANFMTVGTQLQLRPYVSADGMIRMEVHPVRSTGTIDANGLPQTSASEVTTNILVPNGTTIVIAGLIDTQNEKTVTGIPYLMDLPWIGPLFRQTTDKPTRKELVVILTPHIWRADAPSKLNGLGRPQSLGLDQRVEKASSCLEPQFGPTLLETPSLSGESKKNSPVSPLPLPDSVDSASIGRKNPI